MPLGKLMVSGISGHNENTLALSNINFDFSLVKIEAPTEFRDIGTTLSTQRRINAEEGQHHQTARRLGALFEQILPQTPLLIRAYGRRASEISQSLSAKAHGNTGNGAFAGFAGADATSIWAAATSGASAIAIHLLACLLARTWSASEATSIWVEIINERKRTIEVEANEGVFNASLASLMAARQDVSRHDLAQWDASARAWLQSADDIKVLQQKQLWLILGNIHLPVHLGQSTYVSVIEAWKMAMNAVEKLISGQPQRVVNGAVLLALRAWHLFPNLLVLGEKVTNVTFDDELIAPGGRLTVGLQDSEPEKESGVYWSLALSHLRFYGDPVVVSRSVNEDASRFSIEQFHLLVLGCVLGGWGISAHDVPSAARFFASLWQCLQRIPTQSRERLRVAERALLSSSSWLSILVNASKILLGPESLDRDTAFMIVGLGRRRGHDFLAPFPFAHPRPFFGISNTYTLRLLGDAVSHTEQSRSIIFLRTLAHQLKLRPEESIIRVRRPGDEEAYEYITAVPHAMCFQDPDVRAHRRWIETSYHEVLSGCRCRFDHRACSAADLSNSRCKCVSNGTFCTAACYGCNEIDNTSSHGRCCSNVSTGEELRYEAIGLFHMLNPKMDAIERHMRWASAKGANRKGNQPKIPDFLIEFSAKGQNHPPRYPPLKYLPPRGLLCDCYQPSTDSRCVFNMIVKEKGGVALFVRTDHDFEKRQNKIIDGLAKISTRSWIPLSVMPSIFSSGSLIPDAILSYLASMSSSASRSIPTFAEPRARNIDDYLRSLRAIELATRIYEKLPGAIISVDVLSHPISSWKWIPKDISHPYVNLDRPAKFACVALFESGSCNLPATDLADIMAISARNTIYVSQTLLSDPYSTAHADDIALIFGNVGRNGMVLMVPPQALRMRPVHLDSWNLITHAVFDGKHEDSFPTSSLHLSFTGYDLPLKVEQQGAIDSEVFITEAVISLHDRGKWVADINPLVLYAHENKLLRRLKTGPCSSHSRDTTKRQILTSLDTWQELLDPPENLGVSNTGVVRARENWLARLAAACISLQKGFRTVVLASEPPCWDCCAMTRWRWQNVHLKSKENIGEAKDQAEPLFGVVKPEPLPDQTTRENSDQIFATAAADGSEQSEKASAPFDDPKAVHAQPSEASGASEDSWDSDDSRDSEASEASGDSYNSDDSLETTIAAQDVEYEVEPALVQQSDKSEHGSGGQVFRADALPEIFIS